MRRSVPAGDIVMTDSDSLYHRLFSHPLMIEGLVREFVPEILAVDVDFSRIERVPAKFHSETGRRRESDVIWRLPTGSGTDIFLYLLLEFQSHIDWWMAVRIQVYSGLLWQHLITEKTLKAGDRLPPILPIVLYNANPRWNAPTETSALIALPANSPLWPWQPRVRYHLLDEGAFPGEVLARRESLVALLFRLEHYQDPDELIGLIDEVVGWFARHPDAGTLKSLFTELIRHAAKVTKASGVTIPENMMEVKTMLTQRAKEWKEQWHEKWKEQAIAEGKAEVLLRLLNRRFGPLAPEIMACICSADSDRLDDWTDRVLDARTVADVFLTELPH